MSLPVKLRDVVDALEMTADEHSQYLDKRTGEVVMVTNEEIEAAENDEDLQDSPEWQRESILKAREILETDHYAALPDKFDVHEYRLMEQFCLSHPNRKIGDHLASKIKGSGAFGRFKREIFSLGVENDWFRFRQAEFERIAVQWLEDEGIDYSRDDAIEVE